MLFVNINIIIDQILEGVTKLENDAVKRSLIPLLQRKVTYFK